MHLWQQQTVSLLNLAYTLNQLELENQEVVHVLPKGPAHAVVLYRQRSNSFQVREALAAWQPEPEPEAKPAGFDVILTSYGRWKIKVIKAVRELTSLGLKETKELVERAPVPIKEGLTADEAEAVQATLEEAGATITLQPSGR
ncbi:MAG: hypothetical protein CMH57_00900 [Myxococcales bacterium]|nr:hypothetical protein [Myxococcales bacterium]